MISRSLQLDPKKLRLDWILTKQIHTDNCRVIIITRALPLKLLPTEDRSSCSQMSPQPHFLSPTSPLLPSLQCPVHHWRIHCESCQWTTTIFLDWTDPVQAVLALNPVFQCCLVSPAQVSIYNKGISCYQIHNIKLHIFFNCRSVSGSAHPPPNTTEWDLPWCDAIGCRHDPPKSSTMILYI